MNPTGDAKFGHMAKVLTDVRIAAEEGRLELSAVATELGNGPILSLGDLDMAIMRIMVEIRAGKREVGTIVGNGKDLKTLAERLDLKKEACA